MNELACALAFFVAFGGVLLFFFEGHETSALLCGVMATVAFVGAAIVGDMKRVTKRLRREPDERQG